MCMSLDRRLQILLDQERHDRLLSVARERGVSVATVVREAIDRSVPVPGLSRNEAGRRILSAEPMETPDPGAFREELDRIRAREG